MDKKALTWKDHNLIKPYLGANSSNRGYKIFKVVKYIRSSKIGDEILIGEVTKPPGHLMGEKELIVKDRS